MVEKLINHKLVIVIPVYNEARFILKTLESFRNQTYRDFRVLISDNASTDGTSKICRNFSRKDHRFTFIRHEENLGAYKNGIYATESCESEFLMIFDGHDLVAPTFLEKSMAVMESRPDVSLVYSQTKWIDHANKELNDRPDNGANYIFPDEMSAPERYVSLVMQLTNCEAINQLIRRKCMTGLTLRPVISADLIFLSHIIAYGPFYRIEEPLFIRRYFENRGVNKDRVEMHTGERKDVSFEDFTLNFIHSIWSHPTLPMDEKPGIVWVILKIIQKRFDVFHDFDNMKVEVPFPVEIINADTNNNVVMHHNSAVPKSGTVRINSSAGHSPVDKPSHKHTDDRDTEESSALLTFEKITRKTPLFL